MGLHSVLDSLGLRSAIDVLSNFSDEVTDVAYRQAMKAYFIAGATKYVKNFDIKKVTADTFYQSMVKLLLRPALVNSKGMLHNKNLFIGAMHFQDAYDFDTDRCERCIVHYGVLDPANPEHVLQIPFCTFNTLHREGIETEWAKNHSMKLEKTPEQHAEEMKNLVKSLENN